MWGCGTQLTDADDAMLGILGYSRQELENGAIDWRSRTPPEYLHLDEAGIAQAASSGGFTVPYRKEFIRKDGTRIPVLLVCAFTSLEAGTWMGYVVDLTPGPAGLDSTPSAVTPAPSDGPEAFYVRLVGELVRERTRLVATLDHIATPIWSVDPSYRLLGANLAFQEAQSRLSGRHMEIGESVLSSDFPESELRRWQGWYDRAFGGEVVTGNTELFHQGQIIRHDHLLSPIRDESGVTHGVSVVAHDVSQRCNMEDALRASEERFRSLAQASPLGIFETDADGHLRFVNQRMLEIWDHINPADSQHAILHLVHSGDLSRVREAWRNSFRTGHRFESEHRLTVGSLGERFVHVWVAAIRKDDVTVGYVGSVEDATERRAIADRSQRRARMESLGTLAGGVAHDFNNMLAVVMGHTELALAEPDVPVAIREALGEVSTASQRAAELVRQILTFSRQVDHPQTVIDVAQMVVEAARLLKALLANRVQFTVSLPTAPLPVLGNFGALQQALVNLCVNAEHATRGIDAPRIDLALRADVVNSVPVARLSVTDNGRGMSREVADRIFEPFFTTKRPGEGTGMGLAVVHGTIQEHGGSIAVRSTLGHGTTFDIVLPLSTEALSEASVETLSESGSGSILLVEDERPLAKVVARTLERAGYSVSTCHDGLEALALLERNGTSPDLVLTDLVMPRLSGRELAASLEPLFPGLPVLIMSGFAKEDEEAGPMPCNVRRVLQKPLSRHLLLDAVARALEGESDSVR